MSQGQTFVSWEWWGIGLVIEGWDAGKASAMRFSGLAGAHIIKLSGHPAEGGVAPVIPNSSHL